MRRALGHIVLALALVLAGPAAASAADTKRKARCAARGVVKGERVCLKLNARCDRRARSDYLRAGLDCVRRGGYRLVRASAAAKRRGRVIALPTSGIPTFRQALYLFDSQVAALPGVRTPKGAVGRSTSTTFALASLRLDRNRLTPAQRRVFDAALKPSGATVTVEIDENGDPVAAAARTSSRRPRARASAFKDEMEAIVREAVPRLRAKGLRLSHGVEISIEGAAPNGTTLAGAYPTWLDPLFLGSNACLIKTYTGTNLAGTARRRQTLLHELTHCAQFESMSGLGQMALPGWILDGMAEWSAFQLIKEWIGSVPEPGWYQTWLGGFGNGDAEVDLFTRTYDGVGFWTLMAQHGVNVFSLIGPAVQSGGPAVVYRLATGQANRAYISQWGTTLLTAPIFGPRWSLQGPDVPTRSTEMVAVGAGANFGRTVPTRSGTVLGLMPATDIISVFADGNARGWLRTADGVDRALTEERSLCLRPEGCACPGDPETLPLAPRGQMVLGFASDSGSATVRIAGQSFERNCDPDPPPDGGGGGGGGGSPGLEVWSVDFDQGGPDQLLGVIRKCSGGFRGGAFSVRGSGGGFSFAMRIAGVRRPGVYDIPFGSNKSFVRVGGFSSANGAPGGTRPLAGFAVIKRIVVGSGKNRRVRHRVSVGAPTLYRGRSARLLKPGPGGIVC